MVNTPRAKAALGNLKAPSLAQQDVARGYPDVFKQHFHMAVRRIVITKHGERTHPCDAWGV